MVRNLEAQNTKRGGERTKAHALTRDASLTHVQPPASSGAPVTARA
jgi:hypothetical protein